jgi:hypothetical protein
MRTYRLQLQRGKEKDRKSGVSEEQSEVSRLWKSYTKKGTRLPWDSMAF